MIGKFPGWSERNVRGGSEELYRVWMVQGRCEWEKRKGGVLNVDDEGDGPFEKGTLYRV